MAPGGLPEKSRPIGAVDDGVNMMTETELQTIDQAVELIKGVAYPSREMIDHFPAHADEKIETLIAYAVGRVMGIQYVYDRDEKYTKCKTISGT